MSRKTISLCLALIVAFTLAFGVVSVSAAPAAKPQSAPPAVARTIDLGNGNICVVKADGSQTCYGPGTDPQYTDPTYGDCPDGWEVNPDNEAQCRQLVDDSGYSYQPRAIIPATYKCPDGYTGPNSDGQCQKVDVAGHYITAPQPIVDYTCPTVTWTDTETETKHGVTTTTTYTITYTYEKSSDPHKCHRPSDDSLGSLGSPAFSTWPGNVNGKFRSGNPEFLDSNPVYGDCSSLGTGWETDPATAHQCRKWVDTTYVFTAEVVDVAAHYGDCPDGWEVNPDNEAQCRKFVEGSHYNYQAREIIDGTPYCTGDGVLVDSKCRSEIPCPPEPVYVCTNLEGGPYTQVPDGYHQNQDGTCSPNENSTKPPTNSHWCERVIDYKNACVNAAGEGEAFWIFVQDQFEQFLKSFAR